MAKAIDDETTEDAMTKALAQKLAPPKSDYIESPMTSIDVEAAFRKMAQSRAVPKTQEDTPPIVRLSCARTRFDDALGALDAAVESIVGAFAVPSSSVPDNGVGADLLSQLGAEVDAINYLCLRMEAATQALRKIHG